MAFSNYLVFVDESGDHSLSSIDANYPVFVLSFCVVSKATFANAIGPRMRHLKLETFGHDAVVLHEHHIRKGSGAFSKLGEAGTAQLIGKLNELMAGADFTIFAVVIDKNRHKERYVQPAHPYNLAMQFGLERIYNFLRPKGETNAITHFKCESRGAKEDKDLELAFRRVCDRANFQREQFPFELVMADKKANCEGLQLADLTARPIGLSIVRPAQPNRAFDILRSKLATNARGEHFGVGLKVFP